MPAKKRTAPKENGRRNLAAVARSNAMKHLIANYPEAWNAALRSEREKVGLPEDSGRQTRLQKFVERMRAEGVEEEAIRTALEAAGFGKAKA